jgi:hypothetical protein
MTLAARAVLEPALTSATRGGGAQYRAHRRIEDIATNHTAIVLTLTIRGKFPLTSAGHCSFL